MQVGLRDVGRCMFAARAWELTGSVVNEHLSSSNEHECIDVVTAWMYAIRGVSHGNPFFGAEVRIEEGNKLIGRYVV